MNKVTTIVFLDTNGIITSNKETFNRHENYASEFEKFTKYGSEFVILQTKKGTRENIANQSEFLRLVRLKKSSWNIIGRIYEYKKFLDFYKENRIIFICGDPWKPFLQLLVLRMIGKKSYPFQVQIHFDLFDNKWRFASFRNYIKFLLAFPGLKLANNLRFVSEHQAETLKSKNPLNAKKVFVTPVPLNLDLDHIQSPALPRSRSIGFLGRLEKDRGTKFLQPIAEAIGESDIRMIIAGTGSEGVKLNQKISEALSTDRVEFPGYLEGPELVLFWNSIGVLVSTAESESYGRTIREALCYGVPVIAIDSAGARQLKQGPLSEFVHIYASTEISRISLPTIESCFLQDIGRLGIQVERSERLQNEKNLYKSWSELCDT
jgi:glycosyltransferase involved in cell wall biosynthesis